MTGGGFVYFPVETATGKSWIRIDQVAAVTTWEVILIGNPSVVMNLADGVAPDDVLAAMSAALENTGWDAVVDDGPAARRCSEC